MTQRTIDSPKVSVNPKSSATAQRKSKTKPIKPSKKTVTAKATKGPVSQTAHGKTSGIKKSYLKTKNSCKVTFKLPKAAAPDAEQICLVGDFNNWNIQSDIMKKQKNGDYAIALNLEPGRQYQFKYLIDNQTWENDWNADLYVKNPFGDGDNSVVIV